MTSIGGPDLGHSIHNGLVFFVGSHPADSDAIDHELISNNTLSRFGSTNWETNHPDRDDWVALTIGNANSGAYVAMYDEFKSITGDFTIWADVIFIDVAGSSHVLCVPWSSTADWNIPYAAFGYLRNLATTAAGFHFTPSGTLLTYTGIAGSWPTALDRKRLWVRRTGSIIAFGVNGNQVGANVAASPLSPNWTLHSTTPGNKIVLGNRKPEFPGEGCPATYLRLMSFNRALSDQELSDLNTNPLLGLITNISQELYPRTGQIALTGQHVTIMYKASLVVEVDQGPDDPQPVVWDPDKHSWTTNRIVSNP